MKTKLTALLIAFTLVLQSVVFAAYSPGTVKDEITLSGIAYPYETVAFIMLDADGFGISKDESDPISKTVSAYESKIELKTPLTVSEVLCFESVQADEDGKWEYTVLMPADATENGYERRFVFVPSVGEAEYIEYASIKFKNNMLPNILSAAKETEEVTGKALNAQLDKYIGYISGKVSEYRALESKLKVSELAKAYIASIDAGSTTALEVLKKYVDEATVVASVLEGKITDFDIAMSIVDYNAEEKENISSEGIDKILKILKSGSYKNAEEYIKEAKIQFALQQFNYNVNQASDYLLSVLQEKNSNLGLDLAKFNSLSLSKQAQAAKKLAMKKSENINQAQMYLDAIVKELSVVSGGTGGSSGGGGGGASTTIKENKPHNSSSAISITNENIEKQKYVFEDLKDADWAVDAVYYLNKEGIINGYADKTFKPLNLVTRAEFIKMIVSAFFIDKEGKDGYFKDVTGDEWYADYVNIAYGAGIISGDENGCFNPNNPITRQDMAVIIYNAGVKFNLFETVSEGEKFSDDSEIADYAKKAVYVLRNSSVINGVGDGEFAPKINANRASASKIIYELIKNSEK